MIFYFMHVRLSKGRKKFLQTNIQEYEAKVSLATDPIKIYTYERWIRDWKDTISEIKCTGRLFLLVDFIVYALIALILTTL